MKAACSIIEFKESDMKRTVYSVLFALIMVSAAAAADPVEGLWKSIDEKTGKTTAAWTIYERNGELFGEILVVPDQKADTLATECKGPYKGFPRGGDVTKMTLVNTPFIFGLKRKAAGFWEGGNIIDPKDGKMYKCKITFRQADGSKFTVDTLEMRGEIGLGIGRSQYWERTTPEEIENLKKQRPS